MANHKITPAQQRLLDKVAAYNGERYAVQQSRGGKKSAALLVEAGLLVNVTRPTDFAFHVVLAGGVRA